mmetsp:Transcript_77855/g.166953  ORF Transcript_77855/g.166953 Transcript_77855/m.166953 type:complete len:409 (-) Transcript_77855:68-1294(-)
MVFASELQHSSLARSLEVWNAQPDIFKVSSPSLGQADAKKAFQPYHARTVPKPENLRTQSSSLPTTTMMLRNVPNKYSQNTLLQEINRLGFEGTYDFFYLPMDQHHRSNVGYAFVNFVETRDAERFRTTFSDHRFQKFHSRKMGNVCAAHMQGLDANLRHFENRAVTLAPNDQYRPVVLKGRNRVDFVDAVLEARKRALDSAATTLSAGSSPVASQPSTPVLGDGEGSYAAGEAPGRSQKAGPVPVGPTMTVPSPKAVPLPPGASPPGLLQPPPPLPCGGGQQWTLPAPCDPSFSGPPGLEESTPGAGYGTPPTLSLMPLVAVEAKSEPADAFQPSARLGLEAAIRELLAAASQPPSPLGRRGGQCSASTSGSDSPLSDGLDTFASDKVETLLPSRFWEDCPGHDIGS